MDNYLKIDGRKIKLSDETVRNIKEGLGIKKGIPVPENITFVSVLPNKLGMWFGKRQCLWYSNQDHWMVTSDRGKTRTPCKLIPCTKNDLVVGDWVYHTNSTNPSHRSQSLYGLYIGNGTLLWIKHKDDVYVVETCCVSCSYYLWKVVRA